MSLAEMVEHINWALPIIIPLCIFLLGLRYALRIIEAGEVEKDGHE